MSLVNNFIVNSIYNKYISNVIPFLGSFVSDQKNSYEYLAQSIQRFPNQEILKKELIKAGFIKVNYYNQELMIEYQHPTDDRHIEKYPHQKNLECLKIMKVYIPVRD